MALMDVRVPDIGDFKDVAVIELLVKAGDVVSEEQSLLTVESDKASMEIPSPASGVIHSLAIQLGDKVNVGDIIAKMELDSAKEITVSTEKKPESLPSEPEKAVSSEHSSSIKVATQLSDNIGGVMLGLPHASPSVRKFARELGVPLSEVKGSAKKGRITHEDVQAFTREVMSSKSKDAPAVSGLGLNILPWPKIDFTKFGEIERKDISRIKKISGANLHRNWVMIPHVTNNDEADITELENFRVTINKEHEKTGIKVTMLAFVVKAVVSALKKFREFNTSLDGDCLIYKQYYHIGFAADTPNGLVVPVLKNADQKGILQISKDMGELAKKARDGKLSPAEMQGGCFSISSLGGIGGTHFTPIINAPEVAILGLSRSKIQPAWDGNQFQPKLMLPLSLSYDHRVIDGALAARFNSYLASLLADYRKILL